MKYLVLVLVLLAPSAFAGTCVSSDASGYLVVIGPETTDCQALLLSSQEVAELRKTQSLVELEFDPEAFDLGLYMLIKLFVAGLGIGFVLAMISRVKR